MRFLSLATVAVLCLVMTSTAAADSSTYRLINLNYQHNFTFTSRNLSEDRVEVELEIENIGSDSCVLNKSATSGCESGLEISIGIYQAKGAIIWDSTHEVIRFRGNLRLEGVAEVEFKGSPILVVD